MMQAQAIAEQAGVEAPELATDQCTGSAGGFEIFMDVMFWVDIVLTFRTGVIDNRQVWCTLQNGTNLIHRYYRSRD